MNGWVLGVILCDVGFPRLPTSRIVTSSSRSVMGRMISTELSVTESLLIKSSDFCDSTVVVARERPEVVVVVGDVSDIPHCDPVQ